MGNERLRGQMRLCGMSALDLATALAIDPKTVERWLDRGRMPRQPQRSRAAEVLDIDETYLWPQLLDDERARSASRAEVEAVYPHRGAVPLDLWRRLLESTEHHIDVLVYAGLFLVDTHPDFPGLVAQSASEGLEARLLYGRPDSDVVTWRGQEERIGAHLSARIHLALASVESLIGSQGVAIRLHETVLYNSIYRFDDQMLVNTHVVGSPAPQNPVIHLRRVPGGHLFEHYLRSFDRVWEMSKPLEVPLRDGSVEPWDAESTT